MSVVLFCCFVCCALLRFFLFLYSAILLYLNFSYSSLSLFLRRRLCRLVWSTHTYSEKHSKKNSVSLVQKKKLIRIMGKKKGKAKKKTKKKVIKVYKIHFYKPFSITENSIHTTHTHI